MNKTIITLALTASIGLSSMAENYKVVFPISEQEDGVMAYIFNYDDGIKLDSAAVKDGQVVFTGSIDTPVLTTVSLANQRGYGLILEPGTTTFDPETQMFTGTPLNEKLNYYLQVQLNLVKEYNARDTSAKRHTEIIAEYANNTNKMLDENENNPIGYFLFVQECPQWDLTTFKENLQKYPQFASSKIVKASMQMAENKEATSVGHKFKDFEITYDGKTSRLSDYVGKGKYTIVDFWASWCGPCIRQAGVLKELYAKYADKGLDFLGVAVWDEPENTLNAIKGHDLPWPQILNAQSIPTDLYGIKGIPCIILFDPEGNIVSRDKQNEELVSDVTKAMEGK